MIAAAPQFVTDIAIVVGALIATSTFVGIVSRWSLTRWVWRRLVTEPGDARFARRAGLAVGPLIEGVRAAAKAQHDEQNLKIDEIRRTTKQGFESVHERMDAHHPPVPDKETPQ